MSKDGNHDMEAGLTKKQKEKNKSERAEEVKKVSIGNFIQPTFSIDGELLGFQIRPKLA